MALFGWTAFRAPRQLDNRKIDFVCRYKHALIEVQLKSRNLNLKPYNNWCWNVCEKDKELYKEFYDQRHTFLCVVGLKIFNRDNLSFEEVVNDEFPQIAFVPGREVTKYFDARKTKTLRISLGKLKKGKHQWSRYFGEENICRTLFLDQTAQEKENKILDEIFDDSKKLKA